VSKKIASARISEESSKLLQELNNSLPFDRELYQEDIKGSKAHAFMLYRQNILSKDEFEKIERGLNEIREEIERGEFRLDGDDEDIHMAIEQRLTQKIGSAGKRLHTARSRNDQVALDFRLYVQKSNREILSLLLNLIDTLVKIAKKNIDIMLPGMTHLQHAQPINFGYHMIAYASMFKRDFERFSSSYDRNNYSPLGCAALAGTSYNIDRNLTSNMLGFKEPTLNCLDTVSDRDFALEILFNIATMFMHISRLSEELIIWSSSEFSFITLSDRHSTGSSIMPQKKNPDIPELLRAKSGRANGNLVALLTVMKALPLAYNKDMQEDKEPVFDSVKNALLALRVLDEMLADMRVNEDNMQKATLVGHLSATDLADYLVKSLNIPFRDAYHITGEIVNLAEKRGVDISELSLEDLQSIEPRVTKEALGVLDNRACMDSRNSLGGTSTNQTKEQILRLEDWIELQRGDIDV
jgi:argininosuccinate lyase